MHCEQKAEFVNVKTGGIYGNNWALYGYKTGKGSKNVKQREEWKELGKKQK
jgi:hypothetical protein